MAFNTSVSTANQNWIECREQGISIEIKINEKKRTREKQQPTAFMFLYLPRDAFAHLTVKMLATKNKK